MTTSPEPITPADREKVQRTLAMGVLIHAEAIWALPAYEVKVVACEEAIDGWREKVARRDARVVELEAALASMTLRLNNLFDEFVERGKSLVQQWERAEAAEARVTALAEAVDRSETIHEANKRLIATLVASEARAPAPQSTPEPPMTADFRTSQVIIDGALRAEIRGLLVAVGIPEASETFQRFLPPGKTLDQLGEARLRDLYGLCERTRISKANRASNDRK